MTFRARLRRQSAVWHRWENLNQLGGLLCEVQFSRVAPGSYVTLELTAPQVARLRGHSDVVIEAMTKPLPVAPMPAEVEEKIDYGFVMEGHGVVKKTQVPVSELARAWAAPPPAPEVPDSTAADYMPSARPGRGASAMPPEVPETHVATPEERREARQQRLRKGRDQRSSFSRYDT